VNKHRETYKMSTASCQFLVYIITNRHDIISEYHYSAMTRWTSKCYTLQLVLENQLNHNWWQMIKSWFKFQSICTQKYQHGPRFLATLFFL